MGTIIKAPPQATAHLASASCSAGRASRAAEQRAMLLSRRPLSRAANMALGSSGTLLDRAGRWLPRLCYYLPSRLFGRHAVPAALPLLAQLARFYVVTDSHTALPTLARHSRVPTIQKVEAEGRQQAEALEAELHRHPSTVVPRRLPLDSGGGPRPARRVPAAGGGDPAPVEVQRQLWCAQWICVCAVTRGMAGERRRGGGEGAAQRPIMAQSSCSPTFY